MKFNLIRLLFLCLVLAISALSSFTPAAQADDFTNTQFRDHFLRLCDLSVKKITSKKDKDPFFQDSYAIRALCVAYDMTGNTNYLNVCRQWSDQMISNQDRMTPPGAYYMNYNRKPGQTNGDWFAADSSSIGMGLVATSVRCDAAERARLLDSAKKFADLVIARYVKPTGGVTDGCWHQSTNEWWCSSGLFGSFAFNLYANTGDKKYLDAAMGCANWLSHWDLTKKQPFPLKQQGPAMLMYVMECYSAGWPYLSQDAGAKDSAQAKVQWCLNWMTNQQQQPIKWVWVQSLRAPRMLTRPEPAQKIPMQGSWPLSRWWGMKFGGLPFHEYIFSHYFSDDHLKAEGDAQMERLAPLVFAPKKPDMTQLPMFMMMSYAERLDPGDIYRSR
jgi:uncharacterized protein YyaL (SSP411 family)